MHAGTESEFAIHLTKTGMCGMISGLARVVQRLVAHLIAADET